MKKYLDKILLVLAVVVVIVGIKIKDDSDKLEIVTEAPEDIPDVEEVYASSEEEIFMAYISGEVINPGVYEFSLGQRVVDLVEKAGGFSDLAKTDINLSLKLSDEMHVYIPNINEEVESISLSSDGGQDKLVNINSASKEELMTLSGIGDKKAEEIIKYRENQKFEKIEDLMNISGIGEKTFEKLKNMISI